MKADVDMGVLDGVQVRSEGEYYAALVSHLFFALLPVGIIGRPVPLIESRFFHQRR